MDEIKRKFTNRVGNSITKFTQSAVMILLVEENGETYILFEKRALTMRNQPGDISLPGGRIEEGESPREAAIREAEEELNISRDDIEFIGDMDYFISPYNTIIYPFVGKLNDNVNINPSKDEVDHVFKVPIKFFQQNEPLCHDVELKPQFEKDYPFHLIHAGEDYKFIIRRYHQYFYLYEDYVIWGFTAQIIKSFIDIIN
jgi:8-oxo-dGTP pyrophosphatase MutT (NUDIX family)